MKIIHIASGDLWAGAEVQLYSLVTALRKRPQLEVEVILLNHGELEARLRREGVPVTVFDEQRLSALQIARLLLRHLRRARPDVVHTHRQKENVLGSFAAALAGVPSLRTVHGRPETSVPGWRLDKRLYRLLDRWCGQALQRQVVAVSAELGEVLVQEYPKRCVNVVENGVDPDRVRQAGAVPASLPGSAGRLRIGLVGRLVPVKRPDLFLQIAQRLHACRPGACDFYLVGDGPEADRCVAAIEALGLDGSVHMLGFRADAPAVLAAIDMLLLTSDHEGLPMVLLEAMSLGVPVVASAVGGIPLVLDHGRCGRLVPAQQADCYVDAVLPLLDDPSARAELARQAAERVRERYSAAHSAAAYEQIYRRLHCGGGVGGLERSGAAAPSRKSTGA